MAAFIEKRRLDDLPRRVFAQLHPQKRAMSVEPNRRFPVVPRGIARASAHVFVPNGEGGGRLKFQRRWIPPKCARGRFR